MFPLSQRQMDRQTVGEEEEQRIQRTRMLADDRSQQRALIAEFYYYKSKRHIKYEEPT